jgi:hypothetical protein
MLRADEDSLGDYTESQLYEMITDIYSYAPLVLVTSVTDLLIASYSSTSTRPRRRT